MVFAADYPSFFQVLWTMLVFFMFVIWIWILITVLVDIFRRHDISGWVKALWVVFLVVLPYLGVLIYLIAEHKGMAERSGKAAAEAQEEYADYVKSVAGSGGPAAEIERAKNLLDSGAISAEEFETIKSKALS